MSEETWQQKYAREEAERQKKNKALFEKYRADKSRKPEKSRWAPSSVGDDAKFTDYTFPESTKDTDRVIVVRSTCFRVYDSGRVVMTKHSKTRQKFLCVNGPLAGQRVTDTQDDYLIFNRAYHQNRRSRQEPKVETRPCWSTSPPSGSSCERGPHLPTPQARGDPQADQHAQECPGGQA